VKTGDLDALSNPLAGSYKCGCDERDRSGIGTIADLRENPRLLPGLDVDAPTLHVVGGETLAELRVGVASYLG
jgi:hypothetical protein